MRKARLRLPPHLVKVEDDVQLAHALEVSVQRLDEHLDQIKDAKLALATVDHEAEPQRRILSVHDPRARAKPAARIHKVAGRFSAAIQRVEELPDDDLLLRHRLRTRTALHEPLVGRRRGWGASNRVPVELEMARAAKVVDDDEGKDH